MLVAELCASGIEVDRVYCAADVDLPAGVPADRVVPVRPGALDRVLDTVTSRGIAAVARIPTTSAGKCLDRAVSAGRPVVLAVDLADPGNLGTIVRAAEASGCAAVLVTDQTVDPWSPKVVRSAAGAVFRLPVASAGSPAEAVEACNNAGVATVALDSSSGSPLERLDLAGPVALVLGNEAHGLAVEVVDACHHRGTIEMEGPTESLNVAMAATVACFEAFRQRRASEGPAGSGPGADGGTSTATGAPN